MKASALGVEAFAVRSHGVEERGPVFDRDQRDELVLFLFVGDPDIGNTCVMSREAASGAEAS
ncbi:hypothetical protein [Streptomyces gardneri]|uniref:hypothetical protein n=1 Tax=Streptomyces gardneri TaxID=66892 RepID=UPI0035E2B811